MWRIFWISALVVGLLVSGGIYAAVQATFRFRHPRAPHARIIIDKVTGAAMVAPPVDAGDGLRLASDGTPRAGVPQLVCEQTFYNFGALPPRTMGRHAFAVRNAGSAELLLQPESTTCKCTVSGVSRNRVPPGGEAQVILEWNTGKYNPAFQQSARVKTNDPRQPTLELTVAGRVQATAAVEPAEMNLGAAVSGTTVTATVVVYSQVWKQVRVVEVQAACPGLTWDAQPLAQPPDEYQATAAAHLRLSLPVGTKHGRYRHALRITVEPGESANEEKPTAEQTSVSAQPREHLYLDLEGNVVRPLTVYGSAVGEDGVIDLGDVPQGRGQSVRVLLKVRDPQRDLPNAAITIEPGFLQTSFQPVPGTEGLYELTIALPDDTPPCQFRSQPLGRLRIDTGHPRIGVVELPVSFAVVPRRRLSD